MQSRAPTPLRRSAAAVIALAMTGALQWPALAAPPAPHRCACHARAHGGEHECECARCQAEARAAQERDLEKLPPCHRAAARKALAKESRRAPAGPCFQGSCGVPEAPRALALTFAEPFLLPRAVSLPSPDEVTRLAPREVAAGSATADGPATPPPRRA
jgi:hypothetical protein